MTDGANDDRVADLLAEWEERRLDGRPATPEELCAAEPELIPIVRQAIRQLGQADAMLGRTPLEATAIHPSVRSADAGNSTRVRDRWQNQAGRNGNGASASSWTAATASSSTSLIERLQARDEEGWRRFTVIYGPLVYGWARAAGLGDEDAADVGQEVFQAISTHIAGFRRESAGDSLRGWIWTIARNAIREHFRRRARRPKTVADNEALAELAEVPEPTANDDATTRLAQRALDLIRTDFEPRTWQAFWRTAVEGQRAADVGRDLGLSTAAVYMARSRVLSRLRQELGEERNPLSR